MKRLCRITPLIVVAAVSGMAAPFLAAQAPQSSPATYTDNAVQTCLRQCHNKEPIVFILQTPHAVKGDGRTPFAQHQCETCHGASPEHVAVSGNPVAVVFKGS